MGAGRQREFDKQVALEAAMKVFWANGYSGTSLSDLTDVMGINKPSLYAAFGNKEALFISALDHYMGEHGASHNQELHASKKNLRSRLRAYLKSIARMVCDPSLPGGCFVATTTSESGGDCLPANASQAIARINQLTHDSLVDFFRREISAGNLANGTSPENLADYLLALQFGLGVMGRNGTDLDTLDRVIECAVSKV
ncbi:MAG: TetR/AcrR family transcriptional regulator [Woeseiaceae bacterium]|nr:TetR/AcrR family transcriptional regulator [Woeseiaceae bacterium]